MSHNKSWVGTLNQKFPLLSKEFGNKPAAIFVSKGCDRMTTLPIQKVVSKSLVGLRNLAHEEEQSCSAVPGSPTSVALVAHLWVSLEVAGIVRRAASTALPSWLWHHRCHPSNQVSAFSSFNIFKWSFLPSHQQFQIKSPHFINFHQHFSKAFAPVAFRSPVLALFCLALTSTGCFPLMRRSSSITSEYLLPETGRCPSCKLLPKTSQNFWLLWFNLQFDCYDSIFSSMKSTWFMILVLEACFGASWVDMETSRKSQPVEAVKNSSPFRMSLGKAVGIIWLWTAVHELALQRPKPPERTAEVRWQWLWMALLKETGQDI